MADGPLFIIFFSRILLLRSISHIRSLVKCMLMRVPFLNLSRRASCKNSDINMAFIDATYLFAGSCWAFRNILRCTNRMWLSFGWDTLSTLCAVLLGSSLVACSRRGFGDFVDSASLSSLLSSISCFSSSMLANSSMRSDSLLVCDTSDEPESQLSVWLVVDACCSTLTNPSPDRSASRLTSEPLDKSDSPSANWSDTVLYELFVSTCTGFVIVSRLIRLVLVVQLLPCAVEHRVVFTRAHVANGNALFHGSRTQNTHSPTTCMQRGTHTNLNRFQRKQKSRTRCAR